MPLPWKLLQPFSDLLPRGYRLKHLWELLQDLEVVRRGNWRVPDGESFSPKVLGPVGQFLWERVEIDIFPAESMAWMHKPVRIKAPFLEALALALEALSIQTMEYFAVPFIHLLGWRFIQIGIPSNPVEVFLSSQVSGSMTIEEPFNPSNWPDRMLVPTPEDRPRIVHALRLAGVLRKSQVPPYKEETLPLPEPGKTLLWELENFVPRAVWSFYNPLPSRLRTLSKEGVGSNNRLGCSSPSSQDTGEVVPEE